MKSQQETLQKTALPIHWITELFKLFQARYLAKWATPISGIEERAVKEWSIGLAGLSTAQIKHGVDSWNEEWPPSLPEFKKTCLGITDQDDWRHKVGAYKFNDTKCLPIMKAQESIAKEEMQKIRDKLNKG